MYIMYVTTYDRLFCMGVMYIVMYVGYVCKCGLGFYVCYVFMRVRMRGFICM